MVPEPILAQAKRKVKKRVAQAHTGTGTIPKAQASRSGRAYRRCLHRFNVRMTRRALRGLAMPNPEQRQVARFAAKFAFPASVKAAHFAMRRMEYARLRRYYRATARPIPRPRTPALSRPRPSAPSATAAPSEAPPDDGGDGEADGDGPPPPHPRPARAKAKRGRPPRRRIFRLWPDGPTFRRRLEKIDAVAAALDGRPDALFCTFTPITPPSGRDRRLSLVPAAIADAAHKLHDALRDRGATHALVPASRARDGAFLPHWHALIAGVDPHTLEAIATRYGFQVHHEPLQDAHAAARYVLSAHQRRHYDRISGSSGFFAYIAEPTEAKAPAHEANAPTATEAEPEPAPAPAPVVSLGHSDPAQTLRSLAANPPPGPVALGPGVVVVNPAPFVAALLQDLDHPAPAVRSAALDQARAFLAALTTTGPPAPPLSPPTGKGVGGRVP